MLTAILPLGFVVKPINAYDRMLFVFFIFGFICFFLCLTCFFHSVHRAYHYVIVLLSLPVSVAAILDSLFTISCHHHHCFRLTKLSFFIVCLIEMKKKIVQKNLAQLAAETLALTANLNGTNDFSTLTSIFPSSSSTSSSFIKPLCIMTDLTYCICSYVVNPAPLHMAVRIRFPFCFLFPLLCLLCCVCFPISLHFSFVLDGPLFTACVCGHCSFACACSTRVCRFQE